jgi:hypothetical protein
MLFRRAAGAAGGGSVVGRFERATAASVVQKDDENASSGAEIGLNVDFPRVSPPNSPRKALKRESCPNRLP